MRVLICGLLARQERIVEKDCPEGVELRFLDTEMSPARWASAAKMHDYTIVMTKFVSHKHTDALHSAHVKITYCSGGTALLKTIIKDLANGNMGIETRGQVYRT